MKVLHVTEYIQGGIATYLQVLLEEQSRLEQGDEFHLVASQQHRNHRENLPARSVWEYDYPGRSPTGLKNLLRTTRAAVKAIQPDIVHLHSSFPGLIGRLPGVVTPLIRRTKCPSIVYSSHGWSFLMDSSRWKRAGYVAVELLLSAGCDRIICISDHEQAAALQIGISSRKCVRIHNGISANSISREDISIPEEIEAARARGELILLFIGRYDRQKGIDLLLDSFRQLMDFPVRLLCVGGQVVGSQSELIFPPNVINLGWATQGQIATLLEYCDALIAPSRWEGFGLVAAEALRARRAVIVSNRGGLPEVIEHDTCGIVVNELTPNSLSEVIRSLDKDQLCKFGNKGHSRFLELFTADRMASVTRNTYLKLIECTGDG